MAGTLQPQARTFTLFPAVVRRTEFGALDLNDTLYRWVREFQADKSIRNACEMRDIATVSGYQPDLVLHSHLEERAEWARFLATVVHPCIQSYLAEHNRISGWPVAGTGYQFKASWTVLYPPGSFQAPHFHPDTFCVLAYYPKVPPRPAPEGALRLINPHLIATATPVASWDYHAEFMPRSGTAIVFPGWMQHYSY
ncbi:MAG: putative 2OG-Fe(II) oxygenase, partial [Wenzhouxiangella sp.]